MGIKPSNSGYKRIHWHHRDVTRRTSLSPITLLTGRFPVVVPILLPAGILLMARRYRRTGKSVVWVMPGQVETQEAHTPTDEAPMPASQSTHFLWLIL